MCFLYSSRVVAPITCISPLAKEGLRIFAASTAPSAEPAPTRVWSSSIKRITFLELTTSSMAFLILSSKSPLYFVPATMPVRSSATIRLSFKSSGTSPETIFSARPSAIAVLPTPGSPIRTGLFFVRRLRIWITLSISFCLPITGSMAPSLARTVKSLPNWSRVGVDCPDFLKSEPEELCLPLMPSLGAEPIIALLMSFIMSLGDTPS